jgi:acyl-CoA reductase-like NAD-dependent aldehyde dehydrogenase
LDGYSSFQGATKELAIRAAESSARAFASWSKTDPVERRELLQTLAQIFKSKVKEIEQICMEEIHCDPVYAQNIAKDGLDLIEECAALTTSAVLGSIPSVRGDAYGLVFKEPLGVILGIAPWNAPIILGLRAVVAPIAAGNTAILKVAERSCVPLFFMLIYLFQGSELSPRVHYFLASLFREAGFPPGVVNFLLHGPSDGPEIFDALIKHRAIRKCNFTGSTQVGRIIAAQAAMVLKPVLLELGGKNFVIVLNDANLDQAAQEIIKGAFMNVSMMIGASTACERKANIHLLPRTARFACRLT